MHDLKKPEQWCKETGIVILDPDGWRGKDDPAWDKEISLQDFLQRASVSTASWPRNDRS